MILAPERRDPDSRAVSAGALVATVLWVLASALFSVYLSQMASYNKAWGSLAAVVIMLTWLWLGGVSLLFGAEIDSELERRRASRPVPAEESEDAPAGERKEDLVPGAG
jgi:membrane protein